MNTEAASRGSGKDHILLDDVIERTEMREGEMYFVQCLSHGLVGIARPGSELESLCKARFACGTIDAYVLHGEDECPECRHHEEKEWRFYVDAVRGFEDPTERQSVAPWVQRAQQRVGGENE